MAQLPVELILVRQLAHGLAVPTFVVDAAGDLVFVNEAAEALLGLDFEDVAKCRLQTGQPPLRHAPRGANEPTRRPILSPSQFANVRRYTDRCGSWAETAFCVRSW